MCVHRNLDLDNLSQFFVCSKVIESSDSQVVATPRAKSNPFCSNSGFGAQIVAK